MAGKGNTVLWVVLIAIGALLVFSYMNKAPVTPTGNDKYPSNLKTTLTLITKDALAPTDTNANVTYYIFKKADGSYVTSGTTSAGTGSVDVNWGEEYTILAYQDSGTKFYPVTKDVNLNDGQSAVTVSLGLMKVSNATISAVVDPVDLNANITAAAGSQVNFEIWYKTTSASSATNAPVIVVTANQTSVQDVYLSGLNKVTCPTRITTSGGTKNMCYQDTTLKTSDGLRKVVGSVLFSSSVTPSTLDGLTVTVIDTQEYADPNYAVTGISAFKMGTENPNDYSNVGASDSATGFIQFAG